MWRLLIRDEARVELRDSRDWYERQRPGLDDEFYLAEAFLRLEESAEVYPELIVVSAVS